jgi:hypothetical protein
LSITEAERGIIDSRESHGIDSRAIAMLRKPGTPPSGCRITSRVVPIGTEWLDEACRTPERERWMSETAPFGTPEAGEHADIDPSVGTADIIFLRS